MISVVYTMQHSERPSNIQVFRSACRNLRFMTRDVELCARRQVIAARTSFISRLLFGWTSSEDEVSPLVLRWCRRLDALAFEIEIHNRFCFTGLQKPRLSWLVVVAHNWHNQSLMLQRRKLRGIYRSGGWKATIRSHPARCCCHSILYWDEEAKSWQIEYQIHRVGSYDGIGAINGTRRTSQLLEVVQSDQMLWCNEVGRQRRGFKSIAADWMQESAW